MASSYVGGLSGAFIPVSEDQGMIDAVVAGALNLEKLEAMTCVCSVGLDMIAIPGSTSASTIAGILADEMAIGMINQKTVAARLIPVIGKDVGDTVEFGGNQHPDSSAHTKHDEPIFLFGMIRIKDAQRIVILEHRRHQ